MANGHRAEKHPHKNRGMRLGYGIGNRRLTKRDDTNVKVIKASEQRLQRRLVRLVSVLLAFLRLRVS